MPTWDGDAVPVGRQLTDADKFLGRGDDVDQLTSFTVGDIFGSETGMQINDQLGALTTDVGNVESIVNDLIAALGTNVQVVSTSTATITTARHVIVTYTGGPVTLTLPDAAAAREITIWKGNGVSAAEITLDRSAGDAGGGGTINGDAASLVLDQGYFGDVEGACWHIVGQGALTWWVDPTWEALADIKSTLDAAITNLSGVIGAEGYGAQVVSGTSDTITDAKDVFVTNTGATINITLPSATSARAIRLHKANSATTQTINLIRDDVAETINGASATLALTWTSVAAGAARATIDVGCGTTGAWHADASVPANATAIAANTSAIATNTSNIATDAARITALEANTYVPSTLACTGASHSWTTEVEADVTYASGTCTIALDANTTQWPVGTSRVVNKLNTSSNTIVLDPQGTHTINGLAANTNVTLMNSSAVPSGTVAAGIWRVKRLSSTAWWVQ
jgi:hypothetical protein